MRFLAGIVLLLFPLALLAQRETSHWFLAGTSNFVEPTGVTTGRPAPAEFWGTMPTSVSDAAGNLLFACDGNRVVDRDLQRMPASATVNLGGGGGRVLAQKIPNSTRYYIFYAISDNTSPLNSSWTLRYAIVDMALNAGKGDLVSYNNIVGSGLSPGYTLVQGNNTGDAWLVTHRITTDMFLAYRITAAGLSATAVTSNAGSHTNPAEYVFRELKTSHDGSMVAGYSYIDLSGLFASSRQLVEVFNFDFASGTLSNKVRTDGFMGSYIYWLQSLEFSPDNRLLYGSFVTRVDGLQPCGFGSTTLYQFNLCYTDPVEFIRYAPRLVNQFTFCYPNISYGKIQLGADKRIHMPFTGIDISTIEFPNRIGTSGTYLQAAYQVAANNYGNIVTPGFQHRDLEIAVKNNIRYNGGCYPALTRFNITNDTISRVEWDFGDPASGASNTSAISDPSHLFSAPGHYNVSAQLFNSNNQLIETVYELVEIKDPQKRLLDGYPADTSFCAGEKLDISLGVVNGIFHWYKKDTDGPQYANQVSDNMSFSGTEKWYVEMRQNDCDGCIMIDSINITVLPKPYIGLGPDRNLCLGDSLQLQVYDPAADFHWSNGSLNTSIWVKTDGIVWVEGEYNNNGCPVRDSIIITSVPNVVFSLPEDTTLCNNQQLLLDPGISPAGYHWQDGSTSSQFVVESAGQYKVSITNSYGCTGVDSIQVSYISADEVNLGADSLLCQGQELILQASVPGASYLWNTGATGNQITVDQTNEYWIRVDNGICVVTDTISVRFDSPPVFSLGTDTTLCPGEQLLLSPGIPGSEYNWQDGSTVGTQHVSHPGTYWVNIVSGGCAVNDTIVIDYFPGQPVLLGPDRRVCEGETVTIDAGSDFLNYLWNTGAASSSLIVSDPGQYSVLVNTVDGCLSRDTVRVLSPYPLPIVNLDDNPALCYNTSRILDAGSGFVDYLWNDGNTLRTKTVSQPGTYLVTVTDNNGCRGQDAVTITNILPLPAGFLPSDTLICQYESVQLKPVRQYASYNWSNSSSTHSIQVSQPGSYTLEVTDEKGCVGKDTVMVLPKNCMEGVFIPNAFSPNHDGKNDVFKPMVFGPVSQYRFTIFNRWGEIVFRSTEPGKAWDGTYKGIQQDTNIFLWTCTYQLPGQEIQNKKGQVILVR